MHIKSIPIFAIRFFWQIEKWIKISVYQKSPSKIYLKIGAGEPFFRFFQNNMLDHFYSRMRPKVSLFPAADTDIIAPLFEAFMRNRSKIDNAVRFLFSIILEFLIIQQIKWVSAYRKMILTWSEEILSKIFLIMAHENANICSMSITQPSEISKILKFHKNSCKIFITKKYNYETRFCSFKKHRNFSLNSLTHKP